MSRASNHLSNLLSKTFSVTPAFRGKGRLADRAGRIVGRLAGSRVSCEVAPGAVLELDLADRIERAMWGGCYEPHVRRALDALLRPGDTFLDAGAHIGYFTVLAAALVGPAGRVFAFEADPDNFARLQFHAAAFSWVQAIHRALWERSGPLEFERPAAGGESGWGSITSARVRGDGERICVNGISLDDWLHEKHPDTLRLMKVDAEGSEPAILRGAKALLARLRPAIVMELNDVVLRQAGSSAQLLAAQLAAQNYFLFALHGRKPKPMNDKQLPREVLALPAERSGELLAAF